LRLDPDLKAALEKVAAAEDRSVAQVIRVLLREALQVLKRCRIRTEGEIFLIAASRRIASAVSGSTLTLIVVFAISCPPDCIHTPQDQRSASPAPAPLPSMNPAA
jgi:hypothetical protein